MKAKIFILTFIGLSNIHNVKSQSIFLIDTPKYLINYSYDSGTAGGGASFIDFDKDGLDDISLASDKEKEKCFCKNNGQSLERLSLLPNYKKEIASLIWADIDNDNDLFVTVAHGYNTLFENKDNLVLEEITLKAGLPMDTFTSYGT